MRKTALALLAAASIAAAALSAPFADATAGLKVTIKPTKPSVGQNVKIHATGARKNNHDYVCIETLGRPGVKPSASYADINDDQIGVHSNSHGVVSCSLPFLPFSKKIHGKKISCPPTRKNKRAGWYCGDAVANSVHRSEYAIARFKF